MNDSPNFVSAIADAVDAETDSREWSFARMMIVSTVTSIALWLACVYGLIALWRAGL